MAWRLEGGDCLTCGCPVPADRLRLGVRDGLYCSDGCMRARRRNAGVIGPRPAELELLDRGVACKLPRCLELADGWLAGSGPWSGPYCFDCLELVLERMEAVTLAPSLAQTLPRLEAAWVRV